MVSKYFLENQAEMEEFRLRLVNSSFSRQTSPVSFIMLGNSTPTETISREVEKLNPERLHPAIEARAALLYDLRNIHDHYVLAMKIPELAYFRFCSRINDGEV